MRRLLLSLAALGGCALPGTAWAANGVIALESRTLRVGDLARLTLREQATLGRLVVARLPGDGTITELSEMQRRALLRRRVPGRELPLRADGPARFTAPASAAIVRSGQGCLALRHALGAGDYLTTEDTVPTPCRPGQPPARLRHDPRVSAPMLTADLRAGTPIGKLALRDGPVIKAGSALHLVAAQGPVMIEREVLTLQPARAGQGIFVSTGSGKVIASRLAAAREGAAQ